MQFTQRETLKIIFSRKKKFFSKKLSVLVDEFIVHDTLQRVWFTPQEIKKPMLVNCKPHKYQPNVSYPFINAKSCFSILLFYIGMNYNPNLIVYYLFIKKNRATLRQWDTRHVFLTTFSITGSWWGIILAIS